MTVAAIADPAARDFLREADPVLARLIDSRPDFRPRAWLDELPPLDGFGTLIFQVAGQQLSVASTPDPEAAGGRRVIFISGNDDEAKFQVVALFEDAGFAVIDLGDLATGGAMQQIHHPLAGVNLIRL
jgi:hypothetical protein